MPSDPFDRVGVTCGEFVAKCALETGKSLPVVLLYLVFCQLFQAAVICTQFLQTVVDWLSEGLQDTLAQSSLYDVLCRSA